ncbi:MAG TPA: gliding motility lipoprotein GldH [Chitinophagaceae bacterium]|nr:gliding motility lipoprotein GldH [Chitinophagaceae bacterium]HNF71975.1 gliding motility lipoprotein GldH [Chitinophagaceae bacterium]
MKYLFTAFALLIWSLLSSCVNNDVFEKNSSFSERGWSADVKPLYEFEISDTAASYQLYFTFRHTDAYPYSNIWLKIHANFMATPHDSVFRIEIPLAQSNGKWLGKGMNELWEHRMPIHPASQPIHFSHPGLYRIQIEQIMRQDPLPQVLSAGIRLEKIIS